MKNKILLTSILSLVLLGCGGTEYEVVQKDKKFSVDEIEVKIGDTVKFINSDSITHHIMLNNDGEKVSHRQLKGDDPFEQTFNSAGEYKVSCAIHPKMKLKVQVSD
jgi:plastocyanin